jgi:hypothetical protein
VAPATRGRQLWLIPVLVVVLALTAVGALIARDRYQEPEEPPQATAVLPSTTSLPPAARPGSKTVVGTRDATGHPLYDQTRALLQSFFDAINARNYDQWRSAVTRDRAQQQPEEDWLKSYQSSRDGSIVIYRIELGQPGTARVLLSFVSTQDVRDAPPELPVACIRWHVVFALTVEDGTWRVDGGPTGTSPQHEEC